MKKGISDSIDEASFLHFMLWFTNGYFFPNHFLIAFLLSILWELFEKLIVNVDFLYNLTIKYWPVPEKYWNETLSNSLFDISLNMLGYYIGSSIRNNNKKN